MCKELMCLFPGQETKNIPMKEEMAGGKRCAQVK